MPEELEALRGVEVICGNVEITEDIDDVSALGDLEEVTGSIVIHDAGIEELTLPSLRVVGGHLGVLGNAQLVAVELPELSMVRGELAVSSNGLLTDLSLPMLAEIGGSMLLAGNSSLESLDQSDVLEIDVVHVNNNAVLKYYAAPASTVEATSVVVADNPALEQVELGVNSGDVAIVGNESLHRIGVPAFSSASTVAVVENGALMELDEFVFLADVESLIVQKNDALASLPGLIGGGEVSVIYISDNSSLQQIGSHELDRVESATIIHNIELDPEQAWSAFDEVEVNWLKIDGNLGQDVPHVGTCPWAEDFECDEEQSASGMSGTGLCVSDPDDCVY